MRDATRVVRAGIAETEPGEPLLAGPVFASHFHAPGDPANVPYSYARFHHPTWTQFERALADLEGGAALVFASGMAAIAAVFETTLRPGDTLALAAESYSTTRTYARERLQPRGINVRLVATAGARELADLDGARLLWLESPTNPTLDVCDLAALAAAARARGTLVAVDNTTATPLAQRPLELGADFSVASDTKALTGHGDLILGHVAVRDAAWAGALRTYRTQAGAIAGPMEVWLAHRSLATLDVRLERQSANALAIVRALAARGDVRDVRYPGLETDPSHALARAQMRGFGCVLAFELAGRAAAERFLSRTRIVADATSFGSLRTTAERRARWGGDAVGDGFIRMSAGCEDAADLIADIESALEL